MAAKQYAFQSLPPGVSNSVRKFTVVWWNRTTPKKKKKKVFDKPPTGKSNILGNLMDSFTLKDYMISC